MDQDPLIVHWRTQVNQDTPIVHWSPHAPHVAAAEFFFPQFVQTWVLVEAPLGHPPAASHWLSDDVPLVALPC